MKTELTIYKILSFLLLPVAALFGLACLSGLLVALSYPPLMIDVFLIACMVIYIVAAFIFLTRGIDNNGRCKPVLRDWIRINGWITMIFFLLAAVSGIVVKADAGLMDKVIKQWMDNMTLPPDVSAAKMQTLLKSSIDFTLALSIVLVIHVFITFHLMRRYRYVFEPERVKSE